MILEKLYVADIQKVSGSIERKICAVGMVKLLTQTPTMLTKYSHLWLVTFSYMHRLYSQSITFILLCSFVSGLLSCKLSSDFSNFPKMTRFRTTNTSLTSKITQVKVCSLDVTWRQRSTCTRVTSSCWCCRISDCVFATGVRRKEGGWPVQGYSRCKAVSR